MSLVLPGVIPSQHGNSQAVESRMHFGFSVLGKGVRRLGLTQPIKKNTSKIKQTLCPIHFALVLAIILVPLLDAITNDVGATQEATGRTTSNLLGLDF